MKKLSPKAEELRQAIQDGIELEGITADAIAQTIVEVLGIDEEMVDSCAPEVYLHESKAETALSDLLELGNWSPS